METKDFKVQIKEIGEDGVFVGYASTYGNIDNSGDVVDRNAFKRTLDHSKGVLPLLWSHKQDEPIGSVTLTDSDSGLIANGKLMINQNIPTADRTYTLMKAGLVKGLSIGYSVVKQQYEGGANHLKEIRLHEVSAVVLPANDSARILTIKSADGSPIIDAELLTDLIERVDSVLTSKATLDDSQIKAITDLGNRIHNSFSPVEVKEAATDSQSSHSEPAEGTKALAETHSADSANVAALYTMLKELNSALPEKF